MFTRFFEGRGSNLLLFVFFTVHLQRFLTSQLQSKGWTFVDLICIGMHGSTRSSEEKSQQFIIEPVIEVVDSSFSVHIGINVHIKI